MSDQLILTERMAANDELRQFIQDAAAELDVAVDFQDRSDPKKQGLVFEAITAIVLTFGTGAVASVGNEVGKDVYKVLKDKIQVWLDRSNESNAAIEGPAG